MCREQALQGRTFHFRRARVVPRCFTVTGDDMRARWLAGCLLVVGVVVGAGPARSQEVRRWRQVHPHWQKAFLLSFRSPDLLSSDPDERWGEDDGRLVAGGILSDFPRWLEDEAPEIEKARAEKRPVLLSLHVHSGYGTGLVTYGRDLLTAEVVNYPWLVRQLSLRGLNAPDVTVVVDTCNAQATAAHQLRPDLVPAGVESFAPFRQWRAASPARKKLAVGEAYRIFTQDRVRTLLGKPSARKNRENVRAAAFEPLRPEERTGFQARLYGPHGVIFATPALFNVLRLGPSPRGTLTAELLHDRLSTKMVDGLLARNRIEFKRFTEFAFLKAAGAWPEITTTAAAQDSSGSGR